MLEVYTWLKCIIQGLVKFLHYKKNTQKFGVALLKAFIYNAL